MGLHHILHIKELFDFGLRSIRNYSTLLHYNDLIKYLYDISRNVQTRKLNPSILQEDKFFLQTCGEIKNSSILQKCGTGPCLEILRSLLCIENPISEELFNFIQIQLLSNSKELSLNNLLKWIYLYSFRFNEKNNKYFDQLVKIIENKIDRISNLSHAIILYKVTRQRTLPDEFLSKLDTITHKILLNKSIIDPEHLMSLIVSLSLSKRRPIPLIRTAVDRLVLCDLSYYRPIIHIVNTFHALKALNFPDLKLLDKFAHYFIENDWASKVKPNAISAVLLSMGQMNWRNTTLLDSIFVSIINKDNIFRLREITNFIMTIAKLNHRPANFSNFFVNFILPNLKTQPVDDLIWLDFIWSLVLLDETNDELISSVLTSKFLSNLEAHTSSEAKFSKSKLLNIRYALTKKVPKLEEIPEINKFEPSVSSKDVYKLSSILHSDLSTFIPYGKFLISNFYSHIGSQIDSEFILGKNLKFLPLNEYGTHNEPLKTIPENYKRVCFLTIGYRDVSLNDGKLIGPKAFVKKSLEELNCIVILHSLSHFIGKRTTLERVTYWQKELNNLFQ